MPVPLAPVGGESAGRGGALSLLVLRLHLRSFLACRVAKSSLTRCRSASASISACWQVPRRQRASEWSTTTAKTDNLPRKISLKC